jgi:hypothetical protein
MSSGLKSSPLSTFPGGDKGFLAGNAKELLRLCLKSVHDVTRRYFYRISAEESVPGTLSYLLSINEPDLVEIFKMCGFYHLKRGTFQKSVFEMWVGATFARGTVEVTTYKKKGMIKLGHGEHPSRMLDQVKEKLDPPRFRMLTADGQGKACKDSLMRLFDKSAATTTTTANPTTTTPAPISVETTTANDAASPIKKLSQRFNITSPDKPKLAMELVCEMDTPQKAPLMRELMKGPTLTIETLNNQQKKFIRVPQCSKESSAMSQNVKHKFVQEIVNTLGAGTETVVDNLHNGALWLCRILADLYKREFAQSATRAGVICITRMSPKGTAAMWTDAKLTKSKSRKISSHLFDWFKQPITAKEPDVDAFAGRRHVKRTYDSYQMTSQKGKKQSEDDIKKRRRDISINYWVSNPKEALEDELISRLQYDTNQAIKGFKFPLLDTPAIVAIFLADHGNIAWRAGMTIIASEQDGQGEPVKVAHLLGKDSYDVLINTAQPILNEGLSHLQDSALLVIRNEMQQECMLVPRKAFVNSYAEPFQKFFMPEPVESDDEHQKVLVDTLAWKSIEQSGSLVYDTNTKTISGVSWQNLEREVVKKEWRDGRVIDYSTSTTLEMFPVVVLGGGDTEWVACAIGKENMAGAHCNHCRRSKVDFHLGRGELWTLKSIEATARIFQDEILPNAANRKTQPAGLHGVKYPSMFCIPVHLWVSPILHDELGLVKDWLTRVEKFCDTRIETLPEEEVNFREHLVILGNMLEDLLMEQDDLNPKETIKDYKTHLGVTLKEIRERDVVILNEATGQMITQPGRVSPQEQQLIDKLTWEIESCTEQARELRVEIKTTKEIIDKKKKQLEEMRSTRDCLAQSGEYAIDRTLSNNGVDRNVYHGKCLIGPHIQRLLDEQEKILEEMETAFVATRALTIAKHPGAACASIEEIAEEMAFFSEVLQCYDVCFALLRRTRHIFTVEEIAELQGAINKLQRLWPTQRNWEEKEASVTPKSHNLWFEVVPQLAYLGRFFHFMEDPIEKLHKLDRLTDAVYCHIRNYEFREECKKKQEATARNIVVRRQLQQVRENRKRKFTIATITNRKSMVDEAIAVKKERRSL